jgi:transcriptional regulator with XRE-family HTH domain
MKPDSKRSSQAEIGGLIDNGHAAGRQIGDFSRLGARIKEARVNRGFNLRALAEIVNCSVGTLSKIENGKTNPSLGMLHKIGAALGINIAALFSDRDLGEKIVMRAGSRPVMLTKEADPDRGGIALERLVPYAGAHLLEGTINIIQPGGGIDTELQHEGEELGYVLEGILELTVEGEIYRLGPGDSFYFRSEMRHTYRNPGGSVARVLWVNTPPTF